MRDGKARRRHDWQRWVLPAVSTSQETGGDTRATDAFSDDAADTAVETGSPSSSKSQAVSGDPPSATAWRDVATKQPSENAAKAMVAVTPADFEAALENLTPSLTDEEVARYARMRAQFEGSRGAATRE